MMKVITILAFSTLLWLLPMGEINAQTVTETDNDEHGIVSAELRGIVLDEATQSPLPYANIYVKRKHKGTISNELGHFTLDISDMDKTDTLRFQYVGYRTRNISLGQLEASSVVYLKEELINLSELLVFGSNPDPKSIVEKVLENKEANYKRTNSKKQAFIRERENADVEDLKFIYKKSTIEKLDREMIQTLEDNIPEHVTSYTDFLGDLYFNKNAEDSITLKVDPIRVVSLKEKEIAEFEQLEEIFENLVTNTGEEEYWKIKSGVFGQKLDIEEEGEEVDIDSITADNGRKVSYYKRMLRYQLSYSSLEDKDQWEFLHKTGKYKYTLAGGTRVNGEDVYIIDFEPNDSGMYVGRMFISIATYALIRADYEYAPGKHGRNIHLLGIGYTETEFSGSIYFEKNADNYELKYFSNRTGAKASVNRSLLLMKKKKRFLWDKTLKELKIRLNLLVDTEESIEYMVLDEESISNSTFKDFNQPKYMEIIYVDQFDDNLWKGYSIIEPTTEMKDYKKHTTDFSN